MENPIPECTAMFSSILVTLTAVSAADLDLISVQMFYFLDLDGYGDRSIKVTGYSEG